LQCAAGIVPAVGTVRHPAAAHLCLASTACASLLDYIWSLVMLPACCLQTQLAFTIIERALAKVRLASQGQEQGSQAAGASELVGSAGGEHSNRYTAGSPPLLALAGGGHPGGHCAHAVPPDTCPVRNKSNDFNPGPCRSGAPWRTLCAPACLCATCRVTERPSARRTARWDLKTGGQGLRVGGRQCIAELRCSARSARCRCWRGTDWKSLREDAGGGGQRPTLQAGHSTEQGQGLECRQGLGWAG